MGPWEKLFLIPRCSSLAKRNTHMFEFQYTHMSLAELKGLSIVQSSDIPNLVHIEMHYKQNILYFIQYLVKKKNNNNPSTKSTFIFPAIIIVVA